MGRSMIYLGAGGYTVLVSCLPCPLNLHTVQYLVCVFPTPVLGYWLLPAPPHTDVQSSGCKNAPSHSPSHPDLTIARDQTSIISTSPQVHQGGQAAQDGLSDSPFMLLVGKMHWTGLDWTRLN